VTRTSCLVTAKCTF